DGQGGLWIESRSALQRISPELDCLTFDDRHGLAGDVTTILLHDNRVYVGTTAGLYVSDPTADAPERLFRRLSPADPVNGLLMVDGELMFGGPRWSVIDAAGRLQVISQEVANGIVRSSRHPGVIYASNFDGVHWARRVDGEWRVSGRVPGVTSEVYDFAEASDGSIWGSLGHGAVMRIEPGEHGGTARVFGAADGVPETWIQVASVEGTIYLSGDGSLRWDPQVQR